MPLHHAWIIPVISTVLAFAAFFVSYGLAVGNDHVSAFLPYISDGGANAPESCIFGQLLNFAALFFGITAYLRHRQIVEFYGHRLQSKGRQWRRCSLFFLWIGYIAAFGTTMVANFQESQVAIVHGIGASMTFLFGVIYLWGQVIFAYRMRPRMISIVITHIRATLTVLATLFLILHEVTQIAKPFVFDRSNGTRPEDDHGGYHVHRYSPDSKFYTNHLVTTMTEWLMAIAFQIFLLSFALELRHVCVHAPKVKLHTAFPTCQQTNR